jgi:hypothetical protein
MASAATKSHQPTTPPEWVFVWRGRTRTYFSTLAAIALVSLATAVLLGTLRVKIAVPQPMAPRKASMIYLTNDEQGRALALRAQEGGPFPSRFQPSQWEGLATMEAAAMAEARAAASPPYVPALRELPLDDKIPALELASKGRPVFPKRTPVLRAAPDPAKMKLAPTLYPLSGIAPGQIPAQLPPFAGTVDGPMTAATWRFLVRLNPEGGVVECVSLANGGEAGALELSNWLQSIRFQAADGDAFRWIAVAVGFSNQPADGPDAR